MTNKKKCQGCLESERRIGEAVKRDGPFSHNIISVALLCISKCCGRVKANHLVKKHGLNRWGIFPVDG